MIKSAIRLIETNFRLNKEIKTAYDIAVKECILDRGEIKGSVGIINNPTANEAVRVVDIHISCVYVAIKNKHGKTYPYEVKKPAKWLKLFDWVQNQANQNYITKVVFDGRYIKNELHIKTTVNNNMATTTYFNARANIMCAALAAACQIGLIKIM